MEPIEILFFFALACAGFFLLYGIWYCITSYNKYGRINSDVYTKPYPTQQTQPTQQTSLLQDRQKHNYYDVIYS
jgi:hypothetical protein